MIDKRRDPVVGVYGEEFKCEVSQFPGCLIGYGQANPMRLANMQHQASMTPRYRERAPEMA